MEHAVDLVLAGSSGLDRSGIVRILRERPDVRLQGVANLGYATVTAASEHEPDVLLLYLRSFAQFEPELIRKVKKTNSRIRVLVMSTRTDRQTVIKLLNSGVDGQVSVRRGTEDLLEAIQVLRSGSRYLCPCCRDAVVREALAREAGGPWPEPHDQLTAREREILRLLCGGYSTRSIAEELHISVRTAETHLQNARQKLGLEDQRELLRYLLSREFPGEEQ